MNRPEGFYWVKWGGAWQPGRWTIGSRRSYWTIADSDVDYEDGQMEAIGPRIVPPDELEGK